MKTAHLYHQQRLPKKGKTKKNRTGIKCSNPFGCFGRIWTQFFLKLGRIRIRFLKLGWIQIRFEHQGFNPSKIKLFLRYLLTKGLIHSIKNEFRKK